VRVVLTDRINTVSGQLTDERGTPLSTGTVVVFSSDSRTWFDGSRYVRAARPDQQGQYRVRGLPPGEYLAVALDYVEQGTWNDPEYLESLRLSAQRFTIDEGGTQPLSLRLASQ